ncbi:hypothetical protein F5Y18DRAFT_435884 [Xylariaceae sp. FL1019]|nr:hypothetical protein F5Y18DRAFT_435884 [Xylariaceae sp. FL1019]
MVNDHGPALASEQANVPAQGSSVSTDEHSHQSQGCDLIINEIHSDENCASCPVIQGGHVAAESDDRLDLHLAMVEQKSADTLQYEQVALNSSDVSIPPGVPAFPDNSEAVQNESSQHPAPPPTRPDDIRDATQTARNMPSSQPPLSTTQAQGMSPVRSVMNSHASPEPKRQHDIGSAAQNTNAGCGQDLGDSIPLSRLTLTPKQNRLVKEMMRLMIKPWDDVMKEGRIGKRYERTFNPSFNQVLEASFIPATAPTTGKIADAVVHTIDLSFEALNRGERIKLQVLTDSRLEAYADTLPAPDEQRAEPLTSSEVRPVMSDIDDLAFIKVIQMVNAQAFDGIVKEILGEDSRDEQETPSRGIYLSESPDVQQIGQGINAIHLGSRVTLDSPCSPQRRAQSTQSNGPSATSIHFQQERTSITVQSSPLRPQPRTPPSRFSQLSPLTSSGTGRGSSAKRKRGDRLAASDSKRRKRTCSCSASDATCENTRDYTGSPMKRPRRNVPAVATPARHEVAGHMGRRAHSPMKSYRAQRSLKLEKDSQVSSESDPDK